MSDRQASLTIWTMLIIALVVNAAGFFLNWYDQFAWFDKVDHGFTTFALTLYLGFVLVGKVLTGSQRHRVLFVLVVASLGLAVGTLWEFAEWAYDEVVPGDNIKGKFDTITDLMMDTLGALLAGVACLGLARVKAS